MHEYYWAVYVCQTKVPNTKYSECEKIMTSLGHRASG